MTRPDTDHPEPDFVELRRTKPAADLAVLSRGRASLPVDSKPLAARDAPAAPAAFKRLASTHPLSHTPLVVRVARVVPGKPPISRQEPDER